MADQPNRIRATREVASGNRKAVLASTTVASLVFSALALKSGNSVFLVAQGVFGLSVCASAMLMARGFDRVGRYVFLLAGNAVIFLYADSLPLTSMLHLFFLLAVLFPMFVLPAEDWKRGLLPTVLPIVLWSLLLTHGPGVLFAPANSPETFSPFYAIASVATILGVFFLSAHLRFLRLYAQVEDQTKASGRQERMVALAQLAATVAHDVNNPLTLILAKAERISRRARSTEAFDEQIDNDAKRVVQTVDRIAQSIAKLHDSARTEIDFERGQGESHELRLSNSHR